MESKTFCQMCGREASAGAAYCVHCGAALPEPMFSSTTTSQSPLLEPAPVSATGQPPSLTPPASVTTYAPPPFSAAAVHYGGFWVRLVAILIDAIIIQMVVLPVSFAIGGMIGMASIATRMPAGGAQIVAAIVGGALGLVAGWIYEAAMQSSSKQATLGKMIFGLQVTDLNGQRISFARATGRHFAKYVSGMILFIGYIMAGFSERKQALHDVIAGTLVRYAR
jgi:uncharacterized RDD family membrane protein YckC